ncbi:hypothetical protein PR202_ga04052 [Eleusine coracana subsp. coracana]|uniref:RING-type domain-containing protein n=1 Tax=Eleusine coracana subsp. coracana TaxID=191504 RepID=A0AAV5BNP7_ELECO|nr:hypothetical protein PR202_ga04052 [Eleusine coracana subsp. coracana]
MDPRRLVLYPPIHDVINRWGDLVYRVQLRGRAPTFNLGDELPWEEAHRRVRELLLMGLDDGRFQASEFCPPGTGGGGSQRRAGFHAGVDDGHGFDEEQSFGGIPALGEAIVDLPETGVKEGECGVCLEDFKTGNKLRMMPCSHSFHETASSTGSG